MVNREPDPAAMNNAFAPYECSIHEKAANGTYTLRIDYPDKKRFLYLENVRSFVFWKENFRQLATVAEGAKERIRARDNYLKSTS